MFKVRRYLLAFVLLWIYSDVFSQELEPRRWSHLPSGVSFFGLGTGYSAFDTVFDAVLQIENMEVDLGVVGAVYIHMFDRYGKSDLCRAKS